MLKPLRFELASRSQASYMIKVALVSALYLSLDQVYREKEGREALKEKIKDGFEYAQTLFDYADGKFVQSELDQIDERINYIFDQGFHDAESAQVYISAMIGLVSELLTDLIGASKKKRKSKKIRPLEIMVEKLESLYVYFSSRTRQDRFDRQGLELTEIIKQALPVAE